MHLPHRHPDCRLEERSLHPTDDITARHASQAIEGTDHCCRYGPLPLAHHVVGLIRIQCRPIGDVCPGRQEGADIADGHLGGLGQSEHEKADNDAQGVEDDEGASEAELISGQRGDDNGDDGVIVRLEENQCEQTKL